MSDSEPPEDLTSAEDAWVWSRVMVTLLVVAALVQLAEYAGCGCQADSHTLRIEQALETIRMGERDSFLDPHGIMTRVRQKLLAAQEAKLPGEVRDLLKEALAIPHPLGLPYGLQQPLRACVGSSDPPEANFVDLHGDWREAARAIQKALALLPSGGPPDPGKTGESRCHCRWEGDPPVLVPCAARRHPWRSGSPEGPQPPPGLG